MLKKVCLPIITSFVLIVTSTPVLAHSGPPFIKINNESTIANPVYAGSSLFKIPYENAPQTYLVGEKINFTVERNLLQVDPSAIPLSKFTWDFGDKHTSNTLDTSHSYSKPGSYFVSLSVIDPAYNDNVELENLQLNIVNKLTDQLPKAVIKVNGKHVSDPLKEPFVITSGQSLELDATSSTGAIKSIKWDFGDGSKLETTSKVHHTFNFRSPYTYSVFPLLRVEDKNGFISDSFVQVTNSTDGSNKTETQRSGQTQEKKVTNLLNYLFISVGFVMLLTIGFLLLKNFSKKKAA